jgi:hypothetical protein
MCYSAQVQESYDQYCDQFGAEIDIETFARLYGMKLYDNRIKTPPGMDAAFAQDARADMQQIRESIQLFRAQQVSKLGQEIVAQRDRLAKAELALQTKPTKKETDDKRIATNKIERALEKLADLQRTDLKSGDSRMYPGYYVPVLIMENGKKIVRPMRYQCRVVAADRKLSHF